MVHTDQARKAPKGTWRAAGSLVAGLALFAAIVPGALTSQKAGATAAPKSVTGLHLPARTGHSDQTWSGYAVTGSGPYTSISGSWDVPKMDCSKGGGDASPWIGIDGWSNDTVEQIGIDLDCREGKASYHPWVEMYPGPSDYFSEKVDSGDTLLATVEVSGDSWVLTESDLETGWAKTFKRSSTDQLASAEAIVEDVGGGGAPPVPDFGVVTFLHIKVDGTPLDSAGTVHKTTLKRGSTKLSEESQLSGGAFTITWLHH